MNIQQLQTNDEQVLFGYMVNLFDQRDSYMILKKLRYNQLHNIRDVMALSDYEIRILRSYLTRDMPIP